MITARLVHMIPLFAMLMWAAITDLRERKIRNWLTLAVLVTGLAQSLTSMHTVSPGTAILGVVVGFAVPFVLFAMGALGGGDVKLLAGVGAWVGAAGVLSVFAIAAIIGMLIVLVQAAWQRRLFALVRNSAVVAVNVVHLRELGVEHVKATGRDSRSVDKPLPYAVPVLLAVVCLAIRSISMG